VPAVRRGVVLSLFLAVLAASAVSARPASNAAGAGPSVADCPVFPADNAWNRRVDELPVARNSATLIRSIGIDAHFHAEFGSGLWDGGPIGIPYTVVDSQQKRVPISFYYAGESDGSRYPISPDAPVEGGSDAGGDRHVLIVDRSVCKLYELYDAHPLNGGRSWHAGSGATFDLRSNRLRPRGVTSADAAGLPIFPGLARYPEVAAGAIRHALRFTAPRTRTAFVWPARHEAGASGDRSLPPMGLRVRLKRSVSLAGLPRQARIVAIAMKRYGLMLADNGSPWFVTGAPDPRWDNEQLHTLDRLSGRDFEVVTVRPRG
jgi:hypothetical protein